MPLVDSTCGGDAIERMPNGYERSTPLRTRERRDGAGVQTRREAREEAACMLLLQQDANTIIS